VGRCGEVWRDGLTLIDEETEEKRDLSGSSGDLEADITKGRIAVSAPIARAIIGKKKGVSVEVVAPERHAVL